MTAFRWITAGALMLAALKLRGERLPERRHWPQLAVLGVLLMGFGNGGVVWAEQYIPSGLAAVLVAIVPFWMVGVERIVGRGHPLRVRQLLGLGLGFTGIVLLVWPELRPSAGSSFLLGVGATQLACLGWAIGSGYSRQRRAEENVLAASGLQMLLGGTCVLVVATLAGEWPKLAFTPRAAGALLYLIVVGSLAGFSAYAYALKYLPVATVSLYAYVNPLIAVLLGTLVLGESLSPRLAVAAAIVLAGMALVHDRGEEAEGRRSGMDRAISARDRPEQRS
jgi:drug/metabolite transporter (DMT)-like permease